MRVHEAGAMHEEYAGGHGPAWLRMPVDVNDLIPQLWARTVDRDDTGVLTVGGVDVNALAAEFGTPAYVVDEADFRSRLRDFRTAFGAAFGEPASRTNQQSGEPASRTEKQSGEPASQADKQNPDGQGEPGSAGPSRSGATVYYAGKSFLCKAVARWVAEEGVNLDICTGGELATAVAAGFPGERLAFHGNNKSEAELAAALDAGVATIVLDSRIEVDRLTRLAKQRGVRPGVMVRTKVGVEAHTHEYIATAHEDQKFGLSLEAAVKAAKHILAADVLHLRGLHSHIGSQIFETTAFEVAARRVIGAHDQIQRETGRVLPELGLGGGFGIAYTTQDDPQSPRQLADGLRKIVDAECQNLGIAVPAITVEPGRAISGPTTFTLYQVGTVKSVDLGAGRVRSYVSVDGGMSDNIRTAMYGASYSVTLASRLSEGPPILARVVGKHCEAGDIVVRDEFLPGDIKPGDLIAVPGTGAYCRSMASNYNHVPRPPVVAVADGTARLIVRGETVDDLLNLDVGLERTSR